MSLNPSPQSILQLINMIKQRRQSVGGLVPPDPIDMRAPERLYSQDPGMGSGPYMGGDAPGQAQLTPGMVNPVLLPGPTASAQSGIGQSMGVASDEFGNPIFEQDLQQGFAQDPLQVQRGNNPMPVRGKYIHGNYQFPEVPTRPDLPSLHTRNNKRETKERTRAAGVAGILGLLLGGAPGAAAVAQGTMGGYQNEADRQNALLQQQDAQQANRAMQESQIQRQQYSDEMGQVTARQKQENLYNQQVDKAYDSDVDNWNKAEDRDSREGIAAVRAELSKLGLDLNNNKATTAMILGFMAAGTRERNADTAAKNANTLAAGVPIRQQQVNGQLELGQGNLSVAERRLEMQQAREVYMKQHYAVMEEVSRYKATLVKEAKSGKPMTEPQRVQAINQLTDLSAEIKVMRSEQQKEPKSNDPEDIETHRIMGGVLEQKIRGARAIADIQAERVGWVADGGGGYKAPPEPTKASTSVFISPANASAMARASKRNTDGIVPLTRRVQQSVGSPTTGNTPVPQPTPTVKTVPSNAKKVRDPEFPVLTEELAEEWRKTPEGIKKLRKYMVGRDK